MTRSPWCGAALATAAACLMTLAWGTPRPAAARPSPTAPPGVPGDAGEHDEPTTVERRAYLMGTRVTLAAIAADRDDALRTLDRLLAGLEDIEVELSTWRDDSLLSALNRQPVAVALPAPERLCDLLMQLELWEDATGGAFDPAVGSLIRAWGLRRGGRRPGAPELRRAVRDAGLEHLAVELHPCRVTRTRDVILDAGAFGKGAAIDRVAPAGDAARAWMVDLGGQVAVGGGDAEAWPVAIAHPLRRDEPALELRLRSGSLATSGGAVRDLDVDGERIGHIVDPRTGRTVSREGSVSVWHDSALVADILSTALYVMGVAEGLAWAEARDVAACFLLPAGVENVEVRATASFGERFLHR